MDQIPVVHIDDHLIFRRGVSEIFSQSDRYDLVASVETSKELYKILERNQVVILLLDIRLQEETGLGILKKVKQEYPDLKVIMFTMHDEDKYISTFVKEGASGYLLKNAKPDEVIKTLDNVIADGNYFNAHTMSTIVKMMQAKNQFDNLELELTKLEITLLKYISEGDTAEEIGRKLYKSPRTIEGYRHKLIQKTKSRNVAELITWAYKHNLIG